MGISGLLFMLISAGLIGIVADVLMPARMPGGLTGRIVTGIVGVWLGGRLFSVFLGTSKVGPALGGIAIIPGIVGALILLWFFGLVSSRRA